MSRLLQWARLSLKALRPLVASVRRLAVHKPAVPLPVVSVLHLGVRLPVVSVRRLVLRVASVRHLVLPVVSVRRLVLRVASVRHLLQLLLQRRILTVLRPALPQLLRPASLINR